VSTSEGRIKQRRKKLLKQEEEFLRVQQRPYERETLLIISEMVGGRLFAPVRVYSGHDISKGGSHTSDRTAQRRGGSERVKRGGGFGREGVTFTGFSLQVAVVNGKTQRRHEGK